MGGILNRTWEMLHDGRFLKKALMIACPVALQGMLNTIVNMVDTLTVSYTHLDVYKRQGPFRRK